MHRRQILRAALALTGAPALARAAGRPDLPPLRALTRGPRHHWFGYYDKLQFDPSGRLALGMQVAFEHRSPRPEDELGIGMVDLEDGDRWIPLGRSRAWGWQQGCMLQWVPGSSDTVLWNDREGERYVARVCKVESGETHTLDHAVYALAPDGVRAVTADFARIQRLRPGYGYAGLADAHAEEAAPESSGVFLLDLQSGRRELVISLAQLAAHEPRADMADATHYVNHLLWSPSGQRFVFLHRWRPDGGRAGFRTRMYTLGAEGEDLHLLDSSGHTSHFIWRDEEHVAAWSRPADRAWGFYVFRDRTSEIEPLGAAALRQDGHLSYLPGGEWLLSDTYPQGEARLQTPYLFHLAEERRVPLGHFASPPAFRGEWRCDTHPRFAPDGRSVVIDTPWEGQGRQMVRIDLEPVLDSAGD